MKLHHWLYYCILVPLWNAVKYLRAGDRKAARACISYVRGEIWKEL